MMASKLHFWKDLDIQMQAKNPSSREQSFTDHVASDRAMALAIS